jgi:hypothetical protein
VFWEQDIIFTEKILKRSGIYLFSNKNSVSSKGTPEVLTERKKK